MRVAQIAIVTIVVVLLGADLFHVQQLEALATENLFLLDVFLVNAV